MAERRNADLPPRMLRTQEAARFLGISLRTLEKHRTYGTGPTYRKIGGRVLYTVEDLQAWADIGARKSTSDKDAGMLLSLPRRHSASAFQSTGFGPCCVWKARAMCAPSHRRVQWD